MMAQIGIDKSAKLQASSFCRQQRRTEENPRECAIPSFAATASQRSVIEVLVVESCPTLGVHISRAVTSLSYAVVRARSAIEASDRVRGRQPDLIIANLSLSDESGWLFVNKLRLNDRGTPVWLFGRTPNMRLHRWAEFSLVERLIFYQGHTDVLTHELQSALSGSHTFRRAS